MNDQTGRFGPVSPINLAVEADFSLGASRVSPSRRDVSRDGLHETLEPRIMQVLVALYQADGRVVSREELIARCWEGRIVGEDAITRAIGRLRRLSEGDDGASFSIETVPRVGYRLLPYTSDLPQPVISGTGVRPPNTEKARILPARPSFQWWALAALVVVGTAGQASLYCFALLVMLTALYLAYRHYHRILGAGGNAQGSPRRKAYDDLRMSLSDGGTPARLYARWLEKALHVVERFFGDTDPTQRSISQHVIGLTRPAPLWTAPALDRCILVAFIYPQALLILGWVMSGHSGPAERVLGLAYEPDPLLRYSALGGLASSCLAYSKCQRIVCAQTVLARAWRAVHLLRFVLWFLVSLCGALVADRLLVHQPGAVGGAVIVTSAVIGAAAGDILIAIVAGLVGAAVGVFVVSHGGVFSATIAACVACAWTGFAGAALDREGGLWRRLRQRLRRSHIFWWFFLAAVIACCFGLARELPRTSSWPVIGPILLFYGLLPALNAPFLWFSVGLTRALLWLGLERKGWWPYFYALLDAAIAVLVIVLLVVVMVVGSQTINLMAAKGGGQPILPIAPLLAAIADGLQRKSFEPEYWWVYTLLLSAMIPSLVNLAIGGFSLVRGIPVLSRHLHAYLPSEQAVAPSDRNWISSVLAIQAMAGICLGVLAQFVLLPWWIFGYVLPGLGFGALKFAMSVEAFDVPLRIFR